MTELTQNGKNRHFRKAADFMSYFESLYPASDALTKQVQRAVQSLHMPKDADGFLLWTRQLHRWNRNNALGNYWQMQMSPPSNGTGRDRFPVRTLPYAGTSAAYIRTE